MAGALSEGDRERVKALALALGFDLAGVAPAAPAANAARLREWLARGYAGGMVWLARRVEERIDPRRLWPEARSVLAVGLVYDPGERADTPSGHADVARYAGGDDYHDVLGERLRAVAVALEALLGRAVAWRAYVDTGPVLERPIAAAAGLGWTGKNTLLIHPRLGSYLFLGVLLLDLALPPDAPEPDHCGSCRACLDACPTGALVEPGVLDATRCLSYTTIELRDAVPLALRAAHGAHVFGCDVCQEVCPWNTRERRVVPPDRHGLRARLAPRPAWRAPSLAWLLSLDEDAWRAATRRTALRRAKHRFLLRNALVAAGNGGGPELRPWIEHHAASADAMVAEHARWALARIEAASRAAGPDA
ncbi:MAG TPA: tRNA epoxyqueuosine(34) reductase QueG [Myxococcota bacterium]|nr:tRNA epoxyqueuosine(34) reductase QueG [Myxococcota bacterium]